MAQKPSIPAGTRDFSPVEMAKRNFIFDTIKSVFLKYGYQPIETPAMENLSTLMGKYGEEGDKLLFKILNSGDYTNKIETKSRGLNRSQLNKLLSCDKELVENCIFKIKEIRNRLEGYDVKDIETEFNKNYENDPIFIAFGKFFFYNSNLKYKKVDDFATYIDNLTVNMLKSYVLKSINISSIKKIKEARVISEKGLRYDLTVPFARFVVQHQNEISFPFKRYQIQPVWRADRPQKGRYREFYQCDVDVVGSDSLMNEVELIQIVDDVYKALKINVLVKMNNRKILTGIAEIIGEADKIVDITVAIDKLDKIGLEKVNEELLQKGLPQEAVDKLQPIIQLSGTNDEKIATLKEVLATSETGLKGVEEIQTVLNYLNTLDINTEVELDLTLARGLNYYTGAIFEVKALDVEIGSITGGGRYDDLTGIFGLKDVSGVGISFGADRIYDVMNQLDLYPKESIVSTELLFINFGEKEALYSLKALQTIRKAGIKAELYPDAAKMKKQMNYANKKEIAYVAMAGEDEMNQGKVTLKNMANGEQKLLTIDELIKEIQ